MKRLRRWALTLYYFTPVVLAVVFTWYFNAFTRWCVESLPHGHETHVQVALSILYVVQGFIIGGIAGRISGRMLVRRMNRNMHDWRNEDDW